MIPAVYTSEGVYITSRTSNEQKIAAIDAIIDALYAQLLVLAGQEAPILEYMLNDGQTTIKSVYQTPDSITRVINMLEAQRNMYINRINGRCIRMIPTNNLIGRR